jgi:CheY-like chemotaxis protein
VARRILFLLLTYLHDLPYMGYRFDLIVRFSRPKYLGKVQRVSRKQLWAAPLPYARKRASSVATSSKRCFPARHGRISGPELRLEVEVTARGPKTLVWIDDYQPGLTVYKAVFERLGFRVLTASCGKLGLELVDSNPVNAVIVDYEMPEMDGEAVATSIKNSRPELPVILFSGSSLVPSRVRNVVDAVCDKAGSRDELLAAINRVLGNRSNYQPLPAISGGERRQAVA